MRRGVEHTLAVWVLYRRAGETKEPEDVSESEPAARVGGGEDERERVGIDPVVFRTPRATFLWAFVTI